MNVAVNLIDSKEEILKIDRNFWKFATKSLDESEFFYVNFNLNDNSKDVQKVKVLYSNSSSIFFARFKKEDILKYAFGFYDSDLQLSLTNFVPLIPSFIFEFNLNTNPKLFESVFVPQESKIHLMLKVYELSNKQVRYLRREGFSLLKEPKFDFYLLDFGVFKPFSKLLNTLNKSKDLKFEVYDNKATIAFDNKIKSKKHSKNVKNNEVENNTKIPPKKENGQYSLYKGVSFNINQLKWISTYRVNNQTKLVGYFDSEEEAYLAREEYIKKIENSKDKKQKSKTVKVEKQKFSSSKHLKKIPKKNSQGKFSEYDEISFDIDKMLWTAHFNNKFLGYFQSEEQAHSYRFKHIMSIPIPPLRNNGRYSLHEGVDFDKVYRLWYAKAGKKIIGKYNSEKEAIEALEKYLSTESETSIGSETTIFEYAEKEESDSESTEDQKKKDKKVKKQLEQKDKEKSIEPNIINKKEEDLKEKQENVSSDLISIKRNLFLTDYDDKFIHVALKYLSPKYDSSIFDFIDVNNLNDMIWDKKNDGAYDVIINLVFTKEDYKDKLDALLKFNFDNSDNFISSLEVLDDFFAEEKTIIENKDLIQFSGEKRKSIEERQEKLKEITAARLEKEKNEQMITDQLMNKLEEYVGVSTFNENFLGILEKNNLTMKNGYNIKRKLENEILFNKNNPEEFEERFNALIYEEASYQSKKDQEKISREKRALDLRKNLEKINQINKNLELFYQKYGKDELSDEFLFKLNEYNLSEDIGHNIKDKLENLISNDELDIFDLDSKFDELLDNEKNRLISNLLNYSYIFLGEDSISIEFESLLNKYQLSSSEGYKIKEDIINLIKVGDVSKEEFMDQLEFLLEKAAENNESNFSSEKVVNDDIVSEVVEVPQSSENNIDEILEYSKNYFGNYILNEKFKNRLMELNISLVKGYSIKNQMNECILAGEVSSDNFESVLKELLDEEIKSNLKSEENKKHSYSIYSTQETQKEAKSILCPRCHKKLRGDENFCVYCGLNLNKNYCTNCGYENDLENNFCVNCGYKL